MSTIHQISPQPLSYQAIENILDGNFELKLSQESIDLISKCRSYLDQKMENEEKPIYGITTGFGSLCNKTISKNELSQLQNNLVMSHACSTGEEVEPTIVKLMLLLKAHALSLGNSGVQVETVQ